MQIIDEERMIIYLKRDIFVKALNENDSIGEFDFLNSYNQID